MKNFKTYNLSVKFYKDCSKLKVPIFLKNQFDRASSSIVLNLAEGNGRKQTNDRKHFFQIAYGSLKECEAILDLIQDVPESLILQSDALGAAIYTLIKNAK